MNAANLPEGWVGTKDPAVTPAAEQTYLNLYTDELQEEVPTSAATSIVRVPSSAAVRSEPTLATRASFSAIGVAGATKQGGGIYDMIPKCCTMS